MMLGWFDDMQRNFLQEILLLPENAFLDYNFAPSSLRRDIGILGFLHKRILGQCHTALMQLLPRKPTCAPWHDKQLDTHVTQCVFRRSLYERSLFHMIGVYNRLPQEVVAIDNVSGFQRCLTNMARRKCANGAVDWQCIFHRSLAYWIVVRFLPSSSADASLLLSYCRFVLCCVFASLAWFPCLSSRAISEVCEAFLAFLRSAVGSLSASSVLSREGGLSALLAFSWHCNFLFDSETEVFISLCG